MEFDCHKLNPPVDCCSICHRSIEDTKSINHPVLGPIKLCCKIFECFDPSTERFPHIENVSCRVKTDAYDSGLTCEFYSRSSSWKINVEAAVKKTMEQARLNISKGFFTIHMPNIPEDLP